MSALPYQPVPTASQQRELERWVQRKYPVRQYRDNVDESIADFQAARLRYEERQPEPCQFCAVEEEAPVTLPEFVLLTAKGLVCIAGWLAFGLAVLWLCDVAGQYFGSHV